MNTVPESALAGVLDFHSHILPQMDDGSDSAQTSCAMLSEAWRQGVRAMVATPHFYPENEAPAAFLKRRTEAVKRLLAGGYDTTCHPTVYIGAEVAYYPGIARSEALEQLCIVGTRVLLIEMPFTPWTQTMIDEIVSIRSVRALIPVLAHVDRYDDACRRNMPEQLAERGIMMQINAECFDRMMPRRRALRWLHNGVVQLIGSDCHNMGGRPPSMPVAFSHLMSDADAPVRDFIVAHGQGLVSGALTLADVGRVYRRHTEKKIER